MHSFNLPFYEVSKWTRAYSQQTNAMEVKTSTKIALGVLLGLSKTLYDGTFCYYNYRVINAPNAGNNFWETTGKEYVTRASENVDLSSYELNLEDESITNASFNAKWSGPVYNVVPFKLRLFEYLPIASFERKSSNGSCIKLDAHLNDGR